MLRLTVIACVLAVCYGMSAEIQPEDLKETAPATFLAEFSTGKPNGKFTVLVERSWAPHGADRFYNLVKNGFYDGCRVFRNVPNFVAQFGINGDPNVQGNWRGGSANIPDDDVKQSNKRGTLVFATSGPNSRTTQIFINTNDNAFLDSQGFSPIGKIVKGMDAVDAMYTGYGEAPDQGKIQDDGNAYLKTSFPELSFFETVGIAKGEVSGLDDVVPENDDELSEDERGAFY